MCCSCYLWGRGPGPDGLVKSFWRGGRKSGLRGEVKTWFEGLNTRVWDLG